MRRSDARPSGRRKAAASAPNRSPLHPGRSPVPGPRRCVPTSRPHLVPGNSPGPCPWAPLGHACDPGCASPHAPPCPRCPVPEGPRRAACCAILGLPAHRLSQPPVWEQQAVEVIAAETERLPRSQRLVMALVHREGLTFAEAACACDLDVRRVTELHGAGSECLVRAMGKAGVSVPLYGERERSA